MQQFRKRRTQARENRGDYVAQIPIIQNASAADIGTLRADEGCQNYFESRWNELPQSVKTAAEALGYNQRMWDAGEVPEALSSIYWDDLTLTKQTAVLELGCNKEKWNDDTRNWNDLEPDGSGPKKANFGFFRQWKRKNALTSKPQLDDSQTRKPRSKPRVSSPRRVGRFFKRKWKKTVVEGEGNREDPMLHPMHNRREIADFSKPQDEPLGETFHDEPLNEEESDNNGKDAMPTPLLPKNRRCYSCNSRTVVMTDLLDDVDVGDELDHILAHVKEDGTNDESVLLYKTSVLQVGLFGRRNFLLGRNSRGMSTTTTADIDASPL
jgi:hypothetical protein